MGDSDGRWNPSIRVNLHWDVFHFHIFLGLQNLLRVWFHATSFSNLADRHCLCYHCLHVFSPQCWGLQMAVDVVFICRIHSWLCLLLLLLLLLLQNKNVRSVPDSILFWLHGSIQYQSWPSLWDHWLFRNKHFCEKDLWNCEDRLRLISKLNQCSIAPKL